ncbi:hypothetical protein F0Q45_18360 [Mycobacterium simiae]|uniref:Uncharacterized protein n=1 Tax=Mycobacterium simiae TaxID=1784 RepID=A0A5B1BN14_MYCSI|nr:hypothetical protein F0Q45_18360 [Mycobacterium simiae]
MKFMKVTGNLAIAGAVSAAVFGLGAGTAQADPGPRIPRPPIPHIDDPTGWRPLAPGQVQRVCPWQSPPGHWLGGPHGIPCT